MYTVTAGMLPMDRIVAQVDNTWVVFETKNLGTHTLAQYIERVKAGVAQPPVYIRSIGPKEGYEFQKEYPTLVVYTSSVDISKVMQCDINIDEPDTYLGQKEQQATTK